MDAEGGVHEQRMDLRLRGKTGPTGAELDARPIFNDAQPARTWYRRQRRSSHHITKARLTLGGGGSGVLVVPPIGDQQNQIDSPQVFCASCAAGDPTITAADDEELQSPLAQRSTRRGVWRKTGRDNNPDDFFLFFICAPSAIPSSGEG